jgi:hypothetical protein
MGPIVKSQSLLLKHFRTIAPLEVPHTLRWFDDQRLGNYWRLTSEEQMALLGHICPSVYEEWLKQIESDCIPALNNDVMRRLSVLVGIHKSLVLLAPNNRPEYAIRWFLTPNDSATCGGKSIKAYLLANNTLEGFGTLEDYLLNTVKLA